MPGFAPPPFPWPYGSVTQPYYYPGAQPHYYGIAPPAAAPAVAPANPAPVGAAMAATPGTQRPYTYVSGLGGSGRVPQPHPAVDDNFPCAHMVNSTGGVGCEPGYNYCFPKEHTKVIVLKSADKPWHLVPPYPPFEQSAWHVPVNFTVGMLMEAFGATNPDKKLNVMYLVDYVGGGRWKKAGQIAGNEKNKVALTLKDMGCDNKRTGLPGQQLPVYLYFTKD